MTLKVKEKKGLRFSDLLFSLLLLQYLISIYAKIFSQYIWSVKAGYVLWTVSYINFTLTLELYTWLYLISIFWDMFFFFEHFVNILSFYIAVIINRMLLREQLTNYISPGDQLGFSDSSNKGDCHFFPVPFETTRCHCRTIGVGLLLRQTP